ncbi:Ppx/GppA phosphatase family protein [Arenicella xantha]|uniref:Exopolyphosphatase/guanosine-5'-triphosphate, 3'-diphosphate pyrophosphatase n=1 Tax=Arenicella xantha TaxID=644221 RepID=A0A395JQ16_9GAMM|nr:Ppx/GppA phosphatase family protein [Arenicella xantha]RBP50800.1 exopolyphosphatase/guanosine-5'-triphosphate,3'-diphosphate pyrophosphatase [Arenicella xantha]
MSDQPSSNASIVGDQTVNPFNTEAGSSLSLGAGGLGDDCYAAVDLGSNSFHMVISRYVHDEFVVLDRQREVVRLAAGLDDNNNLSEEVAQRALDCLSRFGQLLRTLPPANVRAVGTNALRRLNAKKGFMERAEAAIGHNIEIIAGREEARLIYLGVSKWSAYGDESRLVIDIGGGSTEIIAGRGESAVCRESLEVGCVVLSRQYFSEGKLSNRRFKRAMLAAELAIQPVVEQFRLHGWTQVIGCSGTMKSMAEAVIQGGWSKDRLNREGLFRLRDHAIEAGHVDKLNLSGVNSDRLPVFGGGLAILLALFELFDIQEMMVSDIALREGVLYDLVGRSAAEDIRDTTVASMLLRWSVDTEHSTGVRNTAIDLYDQVASAWDIRDSLFRSALGWAAQLHEVGLQISHDGYHKHGAYLVGNADLAGFARRDQLLLAALVRGHRRKFPSDTFEDLPSTMVTPAKRVAVVLRLAVLLHRGRGSHVPSSIDMSVEAQQIVLKFEPNWLESNPLTEADLRQERIWLKSIGLKLSFR